MSRPTLGKCLVHFAKLRCKLKIQFIAVLLQKPPVELMGDLFLGKVEVRDLGGRRCMEGRTSELLEGSNRREGLSLRSSSLFLPLHSASY